VSSVLRFCTRNQVSEKLLSSALLISCWSQFRYNPSSELLSSCIRSVHSNDCSVWTATVWRSSSAFFSINEVNLRLARLVLGWVTVFGFSSWCGTFISVSSQSPKSTQPGIPSWVGAMSTSQMAVTPCGWGSSKGNYGSCVGGR